MNYCYIRISRDKQEFMRQVNIFKERGYINGVNCEYLEEVFTGKTINRPVFNKLLEEVKAGDTIIVESLSRLSRGGVTTTLELITDLVQKRNVNVIIFKEGFDLRAGEKPNSTTSLLLGIFSLLAQFERDLISERTVEGLKARAESGMKLGRPTSSESGQDNFIKTLKFMTESNVGQITGCSICDFPISTFKEKIKLCYNKYETKDYNVILNKLIAEEKWELF